LSSPEQPRDIVLTETREHDLKLRELDVHLISDKSRRVIGVGVLTLLGLVVVCGLASIVVAEIYKAPVGGCVKRRIFGEVIWRLKMAYNLRPVEPG
jgi:hypothetical protein